MDLKYQKRLASDLLGVGESRIKFNPEKLEEISNAVTRRDIERLVKSGAIIVVPKKGVSRARVRKRRKGPGRRKGGKFSTLSRKRRWIRKIRALRKALRSMRDSGKIDRRTYRYYYSKLANFHSVAHLKESIMKEMGGAGS
ncbi:MAG: 50S ribosomal protein L19e [Thermoproteota archaeon]|jgi:large subunit ribosomal protein L19e|uniref:Large ribosomal subunit protein eL19 n=1 Tax=Candidatus Methanodesulfokora washburnensis TaxID=2478471 RepID=A0A429GR94_9CREN|nr:50S ribosomal protein L19e [Candidatus Methanodesulfokores washburnensis]RSN76203.1 50S ribosomal protein L19e [Candidatus Methanodesulfokores washburnensis]RZN62424.1 MAG: 50S ribosomal protein L19e [Candidatus Methanodesulfokores washburnensis]TDA38283.1 MAG: 50S ribosomal protein L19e [Candidatus Korarchaeota archaeon]